jgi:hypothetical protein
LSHGSFRNFSGEKFCEEKMGEKIKKSKTRFLSPAKTVTPEERIRVARETILGFGENLLAEGLGKSLPDDLACPFNIGDEGNYKETQ